MYAKLYGKMLESGIKSIMGLSAATGIKYRILNEKFHGKREWKRKEIITVCSAIGLFDPNEIVDIFLPEVKQK